MRSSLLKLSARSDRRKPDPSPYAALDDGYAVVAQLSRTSDVVELVLREP